jgi:hypothetical protein
VKIKDAKVYPVSDLAQLAQARIQQESDIDPVIAINHGLRKSGFAADALTIVNEKTDKRILMIFHDDKQEVVDYEFGLASQDPTFEFKQIALSELTEQKLYEWMLEELG